MADAAKAHAESMPMMADAFTPAPYFALLRFQEWDRILALPAPDPRLYATTAIWHFARGTAYAAKGQMDRARQEHRAFEKVRKKVPADWLWINNKASDVLAVAAASFEARLAGSDRAAIPYWRKAVELEDKLTYDEPPAWYYPVRESLGGALLRSGDAAGAEAVFREGLRMKPRNGRMLFGLAESLKAQNKDASGVMQEFERAWKRADVTLRVADL